MNKLFREKKFFSFAKKFSRKPLGMLGFSIILLFLLLALFAPLIRGHDPFVQDLSRREWGLFSPDHFLGTDNYGRDMWSRLIYAGRNSLIVGPLAVLVGSFFGAIFGLLGGYFSLIDNLVMRFIDLLFAFPGLLLAMLIVAMLGPGLLTVGYAIAIGSIPSSARLVRSSVLTVKNQNYILVLKSLGARPFRILFLHILPNILSPLIVYISTRMATATLSASALSYLGLGIQPPQPEWGAMVSSGQAYLWTAAHMAILPGIFIVLLVFALNAVGEALKDVLDPQR